jgi:RNA polymerase sigma-70 factor (ECF subfamily)
MSIDSMSETEIIHKLLVKNEQTFRTFIETHQAKVFKVCMGFLHNREDAEDICQEVFIELYNSIQFFKGESSLLTWIYRIAVNKSLNAVQKRKRQQLFNKVMSSFKIGTPAKEVPDAIMEQKETAEVLIMSINKLPENQKIAYTLAKYDDLSYEEISNIMNLSIPAIESLMFRAKAGLKKQLLNYYKINF